MANRRFYKPRQRSRSSIHLSPKHAVNPTCGVCFWCGEDDGTVALCGLTSLVNEHGDMVKSDVEMPHRTVMGYEPCPACVENREGKIFIFEATGHPNGNDAGPIREDLYPTGNWGVLTDNGAECLFDPPEMLEAVLKARVAAVSPDAWEKIQKLGEPMPEAPDKT